MKTTILCFALILISTLPARAQNDIIVGKFSSGDITGWKEQTLFATKKTAYSFIQENGKPVLMGKSSNSASGLLYKINLDPKTYPYIKWSWRVEHTVNKGNEKTKDGHDFAAKLYVIFPRGLFSSTRAIEYVWGNVMHKEDLLRSPYSKNVVMIAMDSGDEMAGKWAFHKRNFAEDYRNVFGEDAPKVGAIAIMTDSDNTHESATGYYGDIAVLPAAKEEEQKPKEPKQKEPPAREQPQKETKPKEPPSKEPQQKEQPKGNGMQLPPSPPATPQSAPL